MSNALGRLWDATLNKFTGEIALRMGKNYFEMITTFQGSCLPG